jgi:transposase
LERVCAIDVGKASGKVCTRVPHPSRPGQRRTRVWDVEATTNAVMELGEYLVGEGIEKITLESTSDYWRIWFYLLEAPVWTCSWSTPARSRTRRAGRRPTSWTVSGRRR